VYKYIEIYRILFVFIVQEIFTECKLYTLSSSLYGSSLLFNIMIISIGSTCIHLVKSRQQNYNLQFSMVDSTA